jgi:hypothetical protein
VVLVPVVTLQPSLSTPHAYQKPESSCQHLVAAADLALQERDLPALQVLEQELEPLLVRAQPSRYLLLNKRHSLLAQRFVHPSVDLIAVLEQLVERLKAQLRGQQEA